MSKRDIFAWHKTGYYHVALTQIVVVVEAELELCYKLILNPD